jgi:general secretion pathway protein L
MNLLVGNPKIKSFLKWWLSELADILPSFSAIPIKSSQQAVDIVLTENDYQLKWKSEGKVTSSINKFSSVEALQVYKQAIEENNKLNVKTCNIYLSEKLILERVVTLPLATEENLNNVIAYEIDRYTPFERDDVYFDAQVQSRNKTDQKIIVLLRVVKKSAMAELLKFIQERQFSIENIACVDKNMETMGDSLRFGEILNSSASNNSSSVNKYLLLSAVILAVIALLLPMAKNYWNTHQYTSELENINHEVSEVKQIISTYRGMKEDIELSASLNEKNTKVIVLLNELTAIIPNDTSLNRLSIEAGVVRLKGTSLSASKLISILDSTQKFTEVKFAAPVTQNGTSGNENFTIQMKLKTSEKSDAVVN